MKAEIGTPDGSSHLGSIDGHCDAGAVKRELGCAAGVDEDEVVEGEGERLRFVERGEDLGVGQLIVELVRSGAASEVLVRLPEHRKVVKLQAIRSWTSLGGVGYCFDDAGVRVSGRDEGIGWLGELK